MPRYRRFRVPGGTYFFTVCLADRPSRVLVDHVDVFRAAYAATKQELSWRDAALVVLPDHVHAVWTLPKGDAAYSERWRRIKARFSNAMNGRVGNIAHPTASKLGKRECGTWQRRFWEHTIRDEADLRAHLAYCWGNPVKHGLVARAMDWPFSSIHRDIRLGRVDVDWAGGVPDGDFDE